MNVALAENPRAVAGGNNPPLSPFEIAQKAIEDSYSESTMWLDGAVVDSKELADGIDNLKKTIAKARKAADEARKVENQPFDDGKAEVQGRYNPLLKKADLAKEACNKALEPWLQAEDRRIKAEAKAARDEADRKQREAEAAIRATDAANLAERAAAEALVTAAKKANVVANKAERVTATAGGTFGKATGLRSVWFPMLADPGAAIAHYAAAAKQEMHAFVQELAERDVRSGVRDIPGFTIDEEKRAV